MESFSATFLYQLPTRPCPERRDTIGDQTNLTKHSSSMNLDHSSFNSLLRWCANARILPEGKRIHALMVKNGHSVDVRVGNLLIRMYGKCRLPYCAWLVFETIDRRNVFSWNLIVSVYIEQGQLEYARELFDKTEESDVITWTSMIAAYAGREFYKESLQCFELMQEEKIEPNKVTFIAVLDACSGLKIPGKGKYIHAHILCTNDRFDAAVGTSLVTMYSKCGTLTEAVFVFSRIQEHDIASWTSMITAYAQRGQGKEAIMIFQAMHLECLVPNKITFVSVLDACTSGGNLALSKKMHAQVINSRFERDVVVGTALVNLYGKLENLDEACAVFDRLPIRSVITWNTIIASYASHGQGNEGSKFLYHMQVKGLVLDKASFLSLMDACATLYAGKNIHAYVIAAGYEADVVIGTSLINMYIECGSLDDVIGLFNKMPNPNVVSWHSMILGCKQLGYFQEALYFWQQMHLAGEMPDKITFVIALEICIAQSEGKRMHAQTITLGYHLDLIVATSIMSLYARFGDFKSARAFLDEIYGKDIVTWNTIISACAQHGHGHEALHLLQQMRIAGLMPNNITFVSCLSACSHAGLISDGCHCFLSMSGDHGITPNMENYNCIIDMLGRAGQLEAVHDLVGNMPFHPPTSSWMSLIGSYRILRGLGCNT